MGGERLVAGVCLMEVDRVGLVGDVVHVESQGAGLVSCGDVSEYCFAWRTVHLGSCL